jgi:hypothetical protein
VEYQDVLKASGRADRDVSAAFRVGSRVYGTYTPDSDHDFVLMLNVREHNELIRKPNINVTMRGFQDFAFSIKEGNIFTLECLFAPSAHVLKKDPWMSTFTPANIPEKDRKWAAVSALEKASADYNKGIKVNDPKRVYHAFRVLDFGIQVVESGRIYDFAAAKKIYETVMTEPLP